MAYKSNKLSMWLVPARLMFTTSLLGLVTLTVHTSKTDTITLKDSVGLTDITNVIALTYKGMYHLRSNSTTPSYTAKFTPVSELVDGEAVNEGGEDVVYLLSNTALMRVTESHLSVVAKFDYALCLAVDWKNNNVYLGMWEAILIVNIATGRRIQLPVSVDDGATVNDITIELDTGGGSDSAIFWIEHKSEASRINKSYLNGQRQVTIFESTVQRPHLIIADTQSKYLFWVDKTEFIIHRMLYSGKRNLRVAETHSVISSLSLDQKGRLVWYSVTSSGGVYKGIDVNCVPPCDVTEIWRKPEIYPIQDIQRIYSFSSPRLSKPYVRECGDVICHGCCILKYICIGHERSKTTDDTESLPIKLDSNNINIQLIQKRNVTGYLMGIMILGLLFVVATLCSIKRYIMKLYHKIYYNRYEESLNQIVINNWRL